MSQEELYLDEDPLEAYKREFKARKREERRLEAEKRLSEKKIEFKILWRINFLALFASTILILDYWLPGKIYKEEAVEIWQETRAKVQMVFITTKHFAFDAPLELDSQYGLSTMLTIEATPILRTVKSVSATISKEYWSWEPEQTIYNNVPYLPYVILVGALVVWRRKDFNEVNYWLSLVPLLLCGLLILISVFSV